MIKYQESQGRDAFLTPTGRNLHTNLETAEMCLKHIFSKLCDWKRTF